MRLVGVYGADETITLPPFSLATMHWLRVRLTQRRTVPCGRTSASSRGVFRVDAKADGQDVAIGGWKPFFRADGQVDLASSP